jgi:nucleotide-binding universal stress UspA family protein
MMIRIRRILCASDFSRTSAKALNWAIDMARANRATLTIMHAYVPVVPLVPEQYIDARTWERVDTQTRRWVGRQMTRLTDKARKARVRVAAVMLLGDPAQQIVRTARTKHSDLIVIGTHGRRGFSKFFLGSVAERVVATAPCPVVTVRGK